MRFGSGGRSTIIPRPLAAESDWLANMSDEASDFWPREEAAELYSSTGMAGAAVGGGDSCGDVAGIDCAPPGEKRPASMFLRLGDAACGDPTTAVPTKGDPVTVSVGIEGTSGVPVVLWVRDAIGGSGAVPCSGDAAGDDFALPTLRRKKRGTRRSISGEPASDRALARETDRFPFISGDAVGGDTAFCGDETKGGATAGCGETCGTIVTFCGVVV